MKKNAIKQVIRVPCIGSFVLLFPFAIQVSNFLEGKTLSFPKACKVLGATNIEPSAEDTAAQAKPIGIIGPQIAILLITSSSVLAKSCRDADKVSFNAIKM